MKQLYYDVEKCLGCRSCEIACAVAHSESKRLFQAVSEEVKSLPRKQVIFLKNSNYPVSCRNCKEPKCVAACMAVALNYNQTKGIVEHDQARCVGCWMCVMSCPYGAIRPNINTKVPLRCDKCIDKDEPSCLKACPTEAILWQEEAGVKK